MSCLMSDVLTGKVSPVVCNATVNAGGKLLKVIEMQHRYGSLSQDGRSKTLSLCDPDRRAAAAGRIEALERELIALKEEGLA